MQQPIQFKIYTGLRGEGSQWFNVLIFRTQPEMCAFRKEQVRITPTLYNRIIDKRPNYRACAAYWTGNDGRNVLNCGQMLFCQKAVGAGVVSHECTHAALYWCENNLRKFDPMKNNRHDEKLAWMQGWLTQQFWQKWYKKTGEKGP